MNPLYLKTVLILDANQRSALAVTRSLGKHGIKLTTADETLTSLAGSSCYSKRYICYPSPRRHPNHFISAIAELCKQENIDIIFPMTELTTNLLLNAKNQLANIVLPFTDLKTVNVLADKHSLLQLAESLNVPIPVTLYLNSLHDLPAELTKLNYPLVIKPAKSWFLYQGEWLHSCVRFAKNWNDALTILEQDPAFQSDPFLLQEYVPGKGAGIFALYDNGKPLIFFAHKRLREKPPRGGVSVLSESTQLDPRLLAYTRALLDHVGWHGIAMVEFRIDKDGSVRLMEINTRFWGSLQLAVDAGVDFPWLLYQLACREKISPIESYQTGKRLRWILGDLDSLYLTMRDHEFSFTDKIQAILKFLLPNPFKTRHEVNRLCDLGPFWWEQKQYLKNLKIITMFDRFFHKH